MSTYVRKDEAVTFAEIATAVGQLGGAGLLGAVTAGMFGRRRNRADAAAVLTQAASQMVEPLSRELARVREQLELHQRRNADREQRRLATAARHTRWDSEVAEQLRALGADVPPPPPLDEA